MSKKKTTPITLTEFNFRFYGSVAPNLLQIDDDGKSISRPHIEVSKMNALGARTFKTKINRPGFYKFSGFCVNESHPWFYEFKNKRSGVFRIDESRMLTMIS